MNKKKIIETDLLEIIMSKLNEDTFNKIDNFIKAHKDKNGFKDYYEQIELYLIEQELNRLNYQVALEKIAKLNDIEGSKRYSFILGLKYKALLGIGNFHTLQNEIFELLDKETNFSPFFYLEILNVLLSIETTKRDEYLLNRMFQLSASFIGFTVKEDLPLEEMSKDLLEMNKASNIEYGKLIYDLEKKNPKNKNQRIDEYLRTENLGYYKNLAEQLKYKQN